MSSPEYGFCLICLEGILPYEPRSADGNRHRHCDKPDSRNVESNRVMILRRAGGIFAKFRGEDD